MDSHWFSLLTAKLFWPLVRLIAVMSIGLVVAHLVEALHWMRFMAKVASPLVRMGHLQDVAGASFSMAFVSPAASNAMLAESYAKGEITRRELVFANLFNSSPTFLVHLPTLLSLAFAFLGKYAFVYVGLTFAAASLRTICTLVAGRIMLPDLPTGCVSCRLEAKEKPWREVIRTALRRVKKRILKLALFTVPIYCLIFVMQQAGWFAVAERFMAAHISIFPFLRPEAVGIVALHFAAEAGAAFAAASSLIASGSLQPHEIIMALLVGNILSSPMRAFRHQFPSYAGFFAPALALHLVIMNQLCRVVSLVLVAVGYYIFFF